MSSGEKKNRLSLIHRLTSQNSFEEVLDQYNRTASEYDEHFVDDRYGAPKLAADALLRIFPENGVTPRPQVKVMDIASGTGLVGQKLYDEGLRQLDALDPSSEMNEVARKRGIYQRILEDTIGDHRIDVEDSTYDAVTVAGGFASSHCPVTAFDEMIRICKPGGYIINSMRLEYIVTVPEYQKMQAHMQKLEDAGLWRNIARFVTDRFYETYKQGFTTVFQKL